VLGKSPDPEIRAAVPGGFWLAGRRRRPVEHAPHHAEIARDVVGAGARKNSYRWRRFKLAIPPSGRLQKHPLGKILRRAHNQEDRRTARPWTFARQPIEELPTRWLYEIGDGAERG